MADDPELTDRVRRALTGEEDVVEKRMFGSIGFLVRGTLRLGVGSRADHVMLVRVPESATADDVERPGARTAVMRGRPMRNWLFLEREAVETDEQLAHWVGLALAAVP